MPLAVQHIDGCHSQLRCRGTAVRLFAYLSDGRIDPSLCIQDAMGYSVVLTDVIPGFDVEGQLSQWQGLFTVDRPRGSDVCDVRFASQAAALDTLRYLGGGIRGKFRVDPSSFTHLTGDLSKP